MFNNQNKEDEVNGEYKGLKGQQICCPHPYEASQESEDFGSHLKEAIPVNPRALLIRGQEDAGGWTLPLVHPTRRRAIKGGKCLLCLQENPHKKTPVHHPFTWHNW